MSLGHIDRKFRKDYQILNQRDIKPNEVHDTFASLPSLAIVSAERLMRQLNQSDKRRIEYGM